MTEFKVDPGAKIKVKTKPRYEMGKMVLKQELGSKLDWEMIETFQGSYKLNRDQLLVTNHTRNKLDKNQKKTKTLDSKIQNLSLLECK